MFQLKRDIAGIHPEAVFSVLGFPISSSTLLLFVIVVGILVLSMYIYRKATLNPGKIQNVIEALYEMIIGLIHQITGNPKRSEKIFPIVGSLFIFILVSNFVGLIPGVTSVTFASKQIFRTPTSDFNTTFALALAMILLIQLISIREWGIPAYLGKFFQFKELFGGFKKGFGAGFVGMVNFGIGLLDIVSEVAKVVSLSLRLFGNMYAGEVLATVILGGVAYIVPALWLSMNVLTAVVQTLVFALLVTAYYSLAVKPEEVKQKIGMKSS